MRLALVAMLFAVLSCAGTLQAGGIDGSVFLLPISSEFSSSASATYYNDLQQDADATLSGTHSVTGPSIFQTPVYGTGTYSYSLEGPAEPGACYSTSLQVVADPVAAGNTISRLFRGDTRCSPQVDRGPVVISQLCPLLLDLNGDGIHTTGLESPVRFWTFAGVESYSGWTNPASEEAFLWLDSETDHAVGEAELFGSRMPDPAGGLHRNGFQALEKYDGDEFGGNGDGRITKTDRIWHRLRLWVDRNHDGVANSPEISRLTAHRIVALNLARVHDHTPYVNGNSLMLVGTYERRTRGHDVEERAMVDVGFTYLP
ncbi:MAG TPA: hypothetical protein VEK57_06405 [Thermoanaerobaculia bacterium]|nr:hypothetical protein [Thermoanaerobaculia bacterium]